MDKVTAIRAGLAVVIFVMSSVQAWDSDVPKAGLLIVFLVSVAIALPAVALLVPLEQTYFLGAFALSFILVIIARLISPIRLPGLFIVLMPAVMALIFTGVFRQDAKT